MKNLLFLKLLSSDANTSVSKTKKIKSFIFLSFFALVLNSCENELVETNSTQSFNDEVTIKNGRLSFQSKEAFARVYKEYVEASDEKLIKYFQPLYNKGFYSLRPIASEENEKFLYDHYIKIVRNNPIRKVNKSSEDLFDYLDDIEDIVGDDTFSAFLNNDAEILVANEIYKYTDVGLFISKENKYNILQDVLDTKSISKNLTIETAESAKQAILAEYPNDGLTAINGDVSYFKQLYVDSDGSGGSSYNPTPSSPVSTNPSYTAFLNNLSNCNPHRGLFGNLFGGNNICIDRYENRRRVKTKAFNYNYFLVYHLGVKCVHQYRGWTGFWRVEDTDEIRLVVEAAQFQYDLNALTGNTAVNNQTKERYYFMNNQKVFYSPNTMTVPNWGTPSTTYFNMDSLPMIFKDDLSFEFFSTGWDWLDGQIQNGIDSNLKASNLNQYFYDTLYSTITSQLQTALGSSTTPPANRTFVAKFPEQGKLIFQKSVLTQGFGIGVRKRTFDWGAEFSLNTSKSDNSGWRMSGGAGNVLVRPTNFRVKIIGAARRGIGWHGSKFNVGID
jgi:hypothetical protein